MEVLAKGSGYLASGQFCMYKIVHFLLVLTPPLPHYNNYAVY